MKNRNNQKNNAGFTAEQRRQVQKEINMFKVDIDRSVFVKTSEERSRLKYAKRMYKKYLIERGEY